MFACPLLPLWWWKMLAVIQHSWHIDGFSWKIYQTNTQFFVLCSTTGSMIFPVSYCVCEFVYVYKCYQMMCFRTILNGILLQIFRVLNINGWKWMYDIKYRAKMTICSNTPSPTSLSSSSFLSNEFFSSFFHVIVYVDFHWWHINDDSDNISLCYLDPLGGW